MFMNSHLKISKKFQIFFLVFFSCLSLQSLCQAKNEVSSSYKNITKKQLTAKNNFSTQILKKKITKTQVQQNQSFKKSIVIDKNYLQSQADISYLKAEAAYYNNQSVQAIDYIKEAISYAPHSLHLHSRLAEMYQSENLFSEAARQYQIIIQKSPRSKFLEKLAQIYLSRGLNEEAIGIYDKLLKQDHKFSYLFQKSLLLIEADKIQEALGVLNLAWQQASGSNEKGQVLLSKAYIYNQRAKYTKQKQIIAQILDLKINSEDLVLKIAKFYLVTQNTKAALSFLTDFQKREEASIEVTKDLFRIYLSLEKNHQAYEQALHLKDLGVLESTHYLFLISYLLEKKNYTAAIPFIKDILYENSSQDHYLYLLAATYQENKQQEISLEEYQKIKKKSQYFIPAQLQVAQLLKEQGQTQKALRHLKQLSQMSFKDYLVENHKPALVYAQYLWDEGKKQKSNSVLTKALERFPDNIDLYFLRGTYLEKSGQTRQALEDMKHILALDNLHAEALNFIAYIYAEKGQNLDEAERMAYKALSLSPRSSYFLDTIGLVHFQKKEYKKALPYFSKALYYNKKDSHIFRHLAEIHYKLKNLKKCEYFFKRALELEKNDRQRLQIKRRLASLQAHL